MKEIQKNIAIFLSVLMLMCSLPISNVLALESQVNFYSSNASTFDEATPDEIIDNCGYDAYWSLDTKTGVLTIWGSGIIEDYTINRYNNTNNSPWCLYNDLIKKVIIDGTITSIGANAFYGCQNLTEITIPDSVSEISDSAFYNCNNLNKVNISDISEWLNIDFSSYSSNPLNYGSSLYLNNQLVTKLIIPYGITEINDFAFSGCESLTEIAIPDSVTSIGDCVFCSCLKLSKITIPNSVTSIGHSAFNGCESLTEIEIPDGVTSIKNYTFENCINLAGVTIGNSVENIE
ncbi:MAG: leucine-rich repeat domain-containing protein, partial [Clostridia bacterium]|nr:leucine-rich repeat domain-containing protein [Clostridia bacterium]